MRRGLTLDLGCGPHGLLLDSMRQHGDLAVGVDFSLGMLEKTRTIFSGELVCADMKRIPFSNNVFDSVVSVNSILPPERKDVTAMFSEIFRILRPNGRLVAYLPSHDYGTKCIQAGIQLKRDEKDFREWDNGGWQCTYTRGIIEAIMREVGFFRWQIEIDKFDTIEEVRDANRVYGKNLSFDFASLPIEEYLLVATK
jgi:SAM-dependent methyltransferase